jgi:S1-C subfamily serine protease
MTFESGNFRQSSQPFPGTDNGIVSIPTLFRFDHGLNNADELGYYASNSAEANVVRNTQASVTHISVQVNDGQGHTSELRGSGVIVDQSGLTGTDNHVVNPTTFETSDHVQHQVVNKQIVVTTADGKQHIASVVDFDGKTDKALIQIAPAYQGERFQAAVLGDSNLGPQEEVLLEGFPGQSNQLHLSVGYGGLYGSRTTIGAIDPTAPPSMKDMNALNITIHTEKGESGGPLFDLQGRVRGQAEGIINNPITGVPDTTVVSPVEDLIALLEHSRRTFGNRTGAPGPQAASFPFLSAATSFDRWPNTALNTSAFDFAGATPYLRDSSQFDAAAMRALRISRI